MIGRVAINKNFLTTLLLFSKSPLKDDNDAILTFSLSFFSSSEAFDKHMSFCILRLESGLDHSRYGRLSHLLDCMEEKPLRSSKVDEKSPDLEKADCLLAAYDSVTSQSLLILPVT